MRVNTTHHQGSSLFGFSAGKSKAATSQYYISGHIMVKPFVLADTGNLDMEDDMRKDDFYYHFSKFYQHRPFLSKPIFISAKRTALHAGLIQILAYLQKFVFYSQTYFVTLKRKERRGTGVRTHTKA
jgi:hypothetical protein